MKQLPHEERFIKALLEKGHTLKLDEDGKLDMFVCNEGLCNGPGCSKCHTAWCIHCSLINYIQECEI